MKTKIPLLVVGSLLVVIGVTLSVAGGVLGFAVTMHRDTSGFFTTSTERFETPTVALTSEQIDLGEPGPGHLWSNQEIATVRLRADNVGEGAVFVGIGPETDVEAYLQGAAHTEVSDVGFDPFTPSYRPENPGGNVRPGPPGAELFWVVQASGTGSQMLTWDVDPGRWAIVIMNADGSPNVATDLAVGVKIDYLVPIALGLILGGLVLLAAGVVMIRAGTSATEPINAPNHSAIPPPSPGLPGTSASSSGPATLGRSKRSGRLWGSWNGATNRSPCWTVTRPTFAFERSI